MGKLEKSARASIVGKREMGRLVRVSNREEGGLDFTIRSDGPVREALPESSWRSLV